MGETHLELALVIIDEPCVDLRENPTPRFLLIRHYFENRFESLAVEFALNHRLPG